MMVVKIKIGDEVRCDRAILLPDRVRVRRDGNWIDLIPPNWVRTSKPKGSDAPKPIDIRDADIRKADQSGQVTAGKTAPSIKKRVKS